MSVRLVADLSDLNRAAASMRRLADRCENMTPLFREIGAGLLASVEERFDAEKDPSGRPWVRLSADTILSRLGGAKRAYTKRMRFTTRAKRKLGSMKILHVSGDLRGSYTYVAGSQGVEVGSNKVQAALDQFGGQAGRGHKVFVPARPTLGISADDEDMIAAAVQNYLRGDA